MTTFEMYGDPHEWPEHLGGGRRWKDAQGSAQNSGAVDLGADSTGFEAIVSNTLSHRVTENFWSASEYWTLRGDCTWQRPGHPGCSIDGLITYARAGRTGLIFDSQDFNVGNTHKLTVKLKISTP